MKLSRNTFRVAIAGTLLVFGGQNMRAATTNTTKSAVVAWTPNSDPSVAGYAVYYGTSSGNYAARIDSGTNTTTTVASLAGGKTYYFVATAYNDALVESPPSVEATFYSNTNPIPVLANLTNLYCNALDQLAIANTATEAGVNTSIKLTFSLDAGAPSLMTINARTGLLHWTPPFSYAGTTNPVTVRVTDNQVPPSTATQSFNIVVRHAATLSFSNVVVAAGSNSSVYLSLLSSIGLTNYVFTLSAPPGRVTNVTCVSLMPTNVSVTQTPVGAVTSTVTVKGINGQTIPTQQPIIQVNFKALAGQHSSFAPWQAAPSSGTQLDGQTVPTNFMSFGRSVVIGPESLVEAFAPTNGQRNITLYGPIGANYALESTTALLKTNTTWSPVYSGTFSNLTVTFSNVTSSSPVIFYRGHTH